MSGGYAAIGLVRPKTPQNIGGVLRAAQAFGAACVITENERIKDVADTGKAYRHIPIIRTHDVLSSIPYDCVPVAVEFRANATLLNRFVHPRSAFYIFGPEDSSLPVSLMNRCKHLVTIPSFYCLNLAAAVNIVLYDRSVKAA